MREVHQIPTLKEIKEKLANKKYFSLLDVKNGFYHIVLNKDSSKLFSFNTLFKIYKFKRLAFGVSSAPDIF